MAGPRGWALVTGASSGIGLELARCAGAEGYNLVLSGRDEAALADLARRIEAESGVTARPCPADLSMPGARPICGLGPVRWRKARSMCW